MKITYYTADVFTQTVFSGAQIAVVPEAESLTTQQMRSIAAELNLSETVFIVLTDKAHRRYQLRIFSPSQEILFGSHTTLAAAYVLSHIDAIELTQKHNSVTFDYQNGSYAVTVTQENGVPISTEISLVTAPETDKYVPLNHELASILDLPDESLVVKSYKPLVVISEGVYLIVPVTNLNALYAAQFDHVAWYEVLVNSSGAREIVLFCRETETKVSDFHLRLLGPKIGSQEDPPVGGAIPAFAAYLCEQNSIKRGTYSFTVERGRQSVRQSLLNVEMDNQGLSNLTVRVGGKSRTGWRRVTLCSWVGNQ